MDEPFNGITCRCSVRQQKNSHQGLCAPPFASFPGAGRRLGFALGCYNASAHHIFRAQVSCGWFSCDLSSPALKMRHILFYNLLCHEAHANTSPQPHVDSVPALVTGYSQTTSCQSSRRSGSNRTHKKGPEAHCNEALWPTRHSG